MSPALLVGRQNPFLSRPAWTLPALQDLANILKVIKMQITTMTNRAAQALSSRTLKRSLAGLLGLFLCLSVFTRIAGGSTPLRVAEGPSEIRGLTLRYALPDGDYIERSFVSENQVRWKLLSGTRRGDQGVEAVIIQTVAPGIFFVNSVDPLSGNTASEVIDLVTATVNSFVTRPNPDDPQRRLEKFSNGTLEIIKGGGVAATRTS